MRKENMKRNYVIGLDFGSDSVRAVLTDCADGKMLAKSVHPYSRWAQGKYCNPSENRFRQHPLDYIEGMETTIRKILESVPGAAGNVAGIGVDTTGSTPCLVDEKGFPLALLPEFADDPDAMFILWKDHTAVSEAEDINRTARTWGGVDYTRYEGGIYSSEWFWAKLLHILRTNPETSSRAASFVEHCDWLPALLCGNTDPYKLKRSRCAAGHKAMWHPDWNGLPLEDFLTRLDRRLTGWRGRLFNETFTSDIPAGKLSNEWAGKLCLPPGIPVAVGAIDAHMGAAGAKIEPFTMCKVMGTSTCDMVVAPEEAVGNRLIRGICGQVNGSIIPGMIGLEAGQSAFGDLFSWFRRILLWPSVQLAPECVAQLEKSILSEMEKAAALVPIGSRGVAALDWMNGRRTPDADLNLKGVFTGLTLGTDAPTMYRALAEASVFGSKMIVERFLSEGVEIRQCIALGGVAKKSPFIMQMTADVLNMPVKIAESDETCALGASIFASVAGGIYPDVMTASRSMGSGFERIYEPIPANVEAYKPVFERYRTLAGNKVVPGMI